MNKLVSNSELIENIKNTERKKFAIISYSDNTYSVFYCRKVLKHNFESREKANAFIEDLLSKMVGDKFNG